MSKQMNKYLIRGEVSAVKKAEEGLEGAPGEVGRGDQSEDLTSVGPV